MLLPFRDASHLRRRPAVTSFFVGILWFGPILLSCSGPAQTPAKETQPSTIVIPPPPPEAWPSGVKNEIERAVINHRNDPVSAYLTIREAGQSKGLSASQKDWLLRAGASLKPVAVAVLERDVQRARAAFDMRDAYVAVSTFRSAAENDAELATTTKTLSSLTDLLRDTMSSSKRTTSVWQISGVTGEALPSYSEMPPLIHLYPNDGSVVVHTSATVKNISSKSDLSYVAWSLSGLRRVRLLGKEGEENSVTEKSNVASRLANDSFFYLTKSDGSAVYLCAFVTNKNEVLRDGRDDAMNFLMGATNSSILGDAIKGLPGNFVEAGREFTIDLLFAVPKNVEKLRLWVLGSPPVAFEVRHEQ